MWVHYYFEDVKKRESSELIIIKCAGGQIRLKKGLKQGDFNWGEPLNRRPKLGLGQNLFYLAQLLKM